MNYTEPAFEFAKCECPTQYKALIRNLARSNFSSMGYDIYLGEYYQYHGDYCKVFRYYFAWSKIVGFFHKRTVSGIAPTKYYIYWDGRTNRFIIPNKYKGSHNERVFNNGFDDARIAVQDSKVLFKLIDNKRKAQDQMQGVKVKKGSKPMKDKLDSAEKKLSSIKKEASKIEDNVDNMRRHIAQHKYHYLMLCMINTTETCMPFFILEFDYDDHTLNLRSVDADHIEAAYRDKGLAIDFMTESRDWFTYEQAQKYAHKFSSKCSINHVKIITYEEFEDKYKHYDQEH